jgi:hypothetical protein
MIESSSPLREEMVKIMDAPEVPVSFSWTAEFKVKDTFEGEFDYREEDLRFLDDAELQEKIFKPMQITNIDFSDDFEKTIMREVWLTCVIPFGMWAKCLFLARDHIQCTIRRVALRGVTLDVNEEEDIDEFVFDVLFHLDESNSIVGVDYNTVSRTDLDNNYMPATIKAELLDRSVEKVRKVTVGGNNRNCKPADFIRNALAYYTKDLEVEGEPAVEVIDMVDPDNQDKRDHIIVQSGTPLLDLPSWVQNHCGGVYNTGLGCYATGKYIYVYPLYKTDRFNDEEKTMTIIRLPSDLMPQVERTFRLEGEAIYVLGLSDAVFTDNSKAKQLAEGSGIRYADSRRFMNGYTENKDNKTMYRRRENNSEYKATDLHGEDVINVSDNKINSNAFRERSNFSRRNGAGYVFQWPNAKHEYIYPCMPVSVLYEDKGEVKELRGVVMGAHTSVQLIGTGMTARKHGTVCLISVFVLPYEED